MVTQAEIKHIATQLYNRYLKCLLFIRLSPEIIQTINVFRFTVFIPEYQCAVLDVFYHANVKDIECDRFSFECRSVASGEYPEEHQQQDCIYLALVLAQALDDVCKCY